MSKTGMIGALVVGMLIWVLLAGCGGEDADEIGTDQDVTSGPQPLVEKTADRFTNGNVDAVCEELIAADAQTVHVYRREESPHPRVLDFVDEAELIGSFQIWVVALDNPNLQQL